MKPMKQFVVLNALVLGFFGVAHADTTTCVGPAQAGNTRQVIELNFATDSEDVTVTTQLVRDRLICGVHSVQDISTSEPEQVTAQPACAGLRFIKTSLGEVMLRREISNEQQATLTSSPGATAVEFNCFSGNTSGVAEFLDNSAG